jgi:hypothetical protein
MSGLMDSTLMQFLYGGTQFMKDKRADEQAEMAKEAYVNRLGLLPGTITEQDKNVTVRAMGSGLLGDEVTRPQFNAQLQGDLMGIPGYAGMAQQMQKSATDNYGAMQRQQSADQSAMIRQQTLSPYQAMQVQAQIVQNNIQNMNALLDDKRAIMKDYNTAAAPYREGLERYENTMNTIYEVGGLENLNQFQQLAMIIDYSKLAKPGEQLTDGEFNTVIKQSGIPGLLAMYEQLASGKGLMKLPQLIALQNAMAPMAKSRKGQLDRVDMQYDRLARESGIGEYKRPAMQFGGFKQIPVGQPGPQPVDMTGRNLVPVNPSTRRSNINR